MNETGKEEAPRVTPASLHEWARLAEAASGGIAPTIAESAELLKAVPALLDELRRLQGERDELKVRLADAEALYEANHG